MDSNKMNEILKGFAITDEMKSLIRNHSGEWFSFGKMNSSVYRKILTNLMNEANLSAEDKAMIYFFASLVKNKNRILFGFDNILSTDEKKKYAKVKTFFETRTVQYTPEAINMKKIAVVHIPHTNPGLDVYFWAITTTDEERTIENMMERTTMVQISLDQEMQEVAKEGYRKFWTETVTGTKKNGSSDEKAKKESRENWEKYYETQATDMYPLIASDFNAFLGLKVKYSREVV